MVSVVALRAVSQLDGDCRLCPAAFSISDSQVSGLAHANFVSQASAWEVGNGGNFGVFLCV